MIYVLILLSVCMILIVLVMRQKQHENNKPIIDHNHRSLLSQIKPQYDQAELERLTAANTVSDTGENKPPYSVLIVDDQAAIRMLLRELFELEGLLVHEAFNGTMAIETVRRVPIDFILLDLKMPDMDGIEALNGIRQWNEAVQVAMITAFGDPLKIEAAKQLGVQSFFTKPFDIEHVKNHVMNSLKKKDCKDENAQ